MDVLLPNILSKSQSGFNKTQTFRKMLEAATGGVL